MINILICKNGGQRKSAMVNVKLSSETKITIWSVIDQQIYVMHQVYVKMKMD